MCPTEPTWPAELLCPAGAAAIAQSAWCQLWSGTGDMMGAGAFAMCPRLETELLLPPPTPHTCSGPVISAACSRLEPELLPLLPHAPGPAHKEPRSPDPAYGIKRFWHPWAKWKQDASIVGIAQKMKVIYCHSDSYGFPFLDFFPPLR